jgi:hypothetical protein
MYDNLSVKKVFGRNGGSSNRSLVGVSSDEAVLDMSSADAVSAQKHQGLPLEGRKLHHLLVGDLGSI